MHFRSLFCIVLVLFSLTCRGRGFHIPIEEDSVFQADLTEQTYQTFPMDSTYQTDSTIQAESTNRSNPTVPMDSTSKRDSLVVDSVQMPVTLSSMLIKLNKNKYGSTLVPEDDTLVVLKPRPWLAVAENFGINALVLSWDYYIQNREYARISKNVLEHNFRTGMV